MKYIRAGVLGHVVRSRPARGEWIEILVTAIIVNIIIRSRPARGEWIEID